MPTPMPASKQNSEVILEKIQNLQCDTSEVKEIVNRLSEKLEGFRLDYAPAHERVVLRVDDAHKRITDLEAIVKSQGEQLLKLSKSIEPLITSNTIIVWFAGGFGVLIITFLFAIITHQVTLTFP